MPLFLKLLKGHVKTVLFFVSLFALGMSLFLTVDTLSIEFVDSLRAQSKQFLGGDVQIRLRKDFSPEQKNVIHSHLQDWDQSEEWRFFTMVAGPDRTLLVQARAVDLKFPLVGEFADSSGLQFDPPSVGEVYAPQSLLQIIGLSVGDSVQIGTNKFLISRLLVTSPDSRFAFAQFTQRLYMNLNDVESAGLLSKGSRIFRHHHFLNSNKDLTESELILLKKSLLKQIKDPEISIESSADSDSELAARFSMAIRLAKLLALFTFLMSALGALQFFFNHLEREKHNRVLFQTLGMSQSKIVSIYFIQGLFLTSLALLLSLGFAKIWTYFVSGILSEKFQITIEGNLRFEAFVLLIVAAFLSYTLLILGPMIQMRIESAKSILRQSSLHWKLGLSVFVIQLVFGYAFAYVVTQSWILSLIFLAILITGFLGMSMAGLLLDKGMKLLSKLGLRWTSWESLRILLLHRPGRSLMVFSLLGLVTLVLYLMPGLNSMLKQQLLPEDQTQLPRWFLIDVQDEHLEELQKFLTARGYQNVQPAPMIRARLMKVNGNDFVRKGQAKTLEEEQEKRMRNRGYNLSYRSSLDSSESIREGQFWTQAWSGKGIPEISVEYRFMQRLGFTLGDTLEFEVEGFPQKGIISSVREVRWSSFKPNFFVQFQPGVLEVAPKTFIVSLPFIEEDEVLFQKEFFQAFPTISLIDLKEVVKLTVSQLEKISIMLTGITFFALLCGLVLLLEIAFELAQSAKKEMHLRFSLGQKRISILWLWLSPLVFWVLSAWALGYGAHILFVRLIGGQLFGDLPWTPELSALLWSFPVMIFFVGSMSYFFYRALVHEKSLEVLKARD